MVTILEERHACEKRSEFPPPWNYREEKLDFWLERENGERVCSFCGELHFGEIQDINGMSAPKAAEKEGALVLAENIKEHLLPEVQKEMAYLQKLLVLGQWTMGVVAILMYLMAFLMPDIPFAARCNFFTAGSIDVMAVAFSLFWLWLRKKQ